MRYSYWLFCVLTPLLYAKYARLQWAALAAIAAGSVTKFHTVLPIRLLLPHILSGLGGWHI